MSTSEFLGYPYDPRVHRLRQEGLSAKQIEELIERWFAENGDSTTDPDDGSEPPPPDSEVPDANAQVMDHKASCRAATTEDITLNGLQIIDGVQVYEGERVLVWHQFDARQNGIYKASQYDWVRSTDANEDVDVSSGMYFMVTEGAAYAGEMFALRTPDPIVVGSTHLTFEAITDELDGGTF